MWLTGIISNNKPMITIYVLFYTGLPQPSLVYGHKDQRGYLGEDIVIESLVLHGKIEWFVYTIIICLIKYWFMFLSC